jgi:type II secretory pathway component PulF
MPSEQEPTKQEFRFEALDQNGQTAKGTVRADSDYEAFTKLKQKGLVVSNLSVLEETVAVEKEAVAVAKETVAVESVKQSEARFRYSGTDGSSEEISGTIQAHSISHASQILNERGIAATRLEAVGRPATPTTASRNDVVCTNATTRSDRAGCDAI